MSVKCVMMRFITQLQQPSDILQPRVQISREWHPQSELNKQRMVLHVLAFAAMYEKKKIAHTVILDKFHVLQDNEIHNSIAAAFQQNSHSSADIPNILGMVFPKQAANDSTHIVTCNSV